MGARKFSAILGILLLICSLVGILVVMYGPESSSSSSSIRIDETITARTSLGAKRQVSESRRHHGEQATNKEENKVTNELERISSNEQRERDAVVWSKKEKTTTAKANNDDANANVKAKTGTREMGSMEVKPKISQTNSFAQSEKGEEEEDKVVESTSPTPTTWNEFPNPSGWRPWVDPRVNLRTPPIRRILSPGEPQKTVTSSSHPDNNAFANSRQPHAKYGSSSSGSGGNSNSPGAHHPSNPHPSTDADADAGAGAGADANGNQGYGNYGSFEGGLEDSQEISEEDQYVLHDVEGYEDEESELQGMDVGELFDLATNLYSSGANSSDLQGFLRIINETVNKGNNSGLLTQLNELYSRPEVSSTLSSNAVVGSGRNAYETSMTAFVFMSFGVFLLNQIHNFIGKENKIEGRNFHLNSLDEDPVSNLELLFKPPRMNGTDGFSKLNLEGNESGFENSSSSSWTDSDTDSSSSTSPSSNNLINRGYINNMFRALLNLVNAYTKDSQVLECIWSLYCQDLDKTAGKQGLYGIAARINSIGLRLIMDQIPAELTLDVMLRSLLGWDGLPCTKMFPKCQLNNAISTLQAATSANYPSA